MADIESTRAKHKTLAVVVSDEDAGPIVLTGKTLRFSAKKSFADTDPATVTKSTGTGIVHSDQVLDPGKAVITILAGDTDTAAFDVDSPTRLEWQLELIQSAGEPEVVEGGRWTVLPAVRRAV